MGQRSELCKSHTIRQMLQHPLFRALLLFHLAKTTVLVPCAASPSACSQSYPLQSFRRYVVMAAPASETGQPTACSTTQRCLSSLISSAALRSLVDGSKCRSHPPSQYEAPTSCSTMFQQRGHFHPSCFKAGMTSRSPERVSYCESKSGIKMRGRKSAMEDTAQPASPSRFKITRR